MSDKKQPDIESIERGLDQMLLDLESEAPSERMRQRFTEQATAPAAVPERRLARTGPAPVLLIAAAVLIATALGFFFQPGNDPATEAPEARLLVDLRSKQALRRLESAHALAGLESTEKRQVDRLLIEALENESHPAVELALIEALARRGGLKVQTGSLPETEGLSETAQWVYLTLPDLSSLEIGSSQRSQLLEGVTETTVLQILADR